MDKKLQLDEDMLHHKKAWKVKRISWAFMAFIILFTLFGLTGGEGILSNKELKSSNYKIKFEKYLRYKKPYELLIESHSSNDTVKIKINGEYLKNFEVENILPETHKQLIIENNIEYYFLSKQRRTGKIRFVFNPVKTGNTKAHIFINGDELMFNQYIFP